MADPRHDPDNPQPAIPASRSSPKTLTIESIDHLRQLISHALEEETIFRDTDKDAWVSGIESALYDLARAVDSGAWLAGIRRARAVQWKRKEQAAAEIRVREQERIAKEKETEARNKTKNRVPASAESTKSATKEPDPAVPEVKTESPHARKPAPDAVNRNLCALQQLRKLANARSPPSVDSKRAHHLLLTVSPYDMPPPPSVPAGDATAQRCTFTSGVYALPAPDLFGEDPDDNCQAVVNSTLYGFEDWDGTCIFSSLLFSSPSLIDFLIVRIMGTHDDIEVIGGTFSLSTVHTADEHVSLVRVLRISTYILLSLLLEQHFLSGSFVELHYPKPKPISPSMSLPFPTGTLSHRNSSPDIQVEGKLRKRDLLRQGIWSLFQKRFNRSANDNTSESPRGSLDFPDHVLDVQKTHRSSLDMPSLTAPRQRRFSIFGDNRSPSPSPATPIQPSPDRPFQTALRLMEERQGLLSASPGLIFHPPQLLVRLAESEKAKPARRLTGEERSGLTSILGWEGKKAAGRGNMTGMAGFLRQQQLSLLYSEHVQVPDRTSQLPADGGISLNKPVEGVPKSTTHVHCGTRVKWITYMYYANNNHDRSLGDKITSMCMRADELCTQPGCKSLRRHHEQRWVHGGVRVIAQTEAHDSDTASSPDVHSEDIDMWQSCKICQKSTERRKMSDGT
jgi:1-phosphatidylinositol-3-phosphate 5-kinase